ncbi:MAG: RagB/SusD family nutrient uptake outer membrane protein [Paludibacter sp.]|nr:RagB/SusD family nutrient uptake outer membrane protein [Paludibacter sp.]
MKSIYIILLMSATLLLNACGDYLDVVPDNVATIDYAFRNRTSAEKYLFTCYSYIPNLGRAAIDPSILGSDEIWIHDLDASYSSSLSAFNTYNLKRGQQNISDPLVNFWDGGNSGSNLYIGIRDCNIFLENINKVIDISVTEREKWIAEVKFLKAYYHYYLMRMYGPIPIVRENLPISASVEEVQVYREPVDSVVKYVVSLIDEAAEDLPLQVQDVAQELGRVTLPVAKAIKAEVLLTAASPLFNGNTAYASMKDNRGIHLFSQEYDPEKWKLAMDAALEAIQIAGEANHQLYEFNDVRYPVSDTTRTVMSIRNSYGVKWNQEIIWGMSENNLQLSQGFSIPPFTFTHVQNSIGQPIFSAPIHIAELFYSNNGVPIEEDPTYDYEDRYSPAAAKNQKYYISENFITAKLNQYREPRFYANLGFDGGVWFGNGRFKEVGTGTSETESWILMGKANEVSGKVSSIRYNITGYYLKKYSNFESAGTTSFIPIRMTFPAIRLADLYLMYAEARNEYSGPDEMVYDYIDRVRARAGLKGVVQSWQEHSKYPDKPANQSGLREIIQRERSIELAFEGKRFWDLRRWKIADEVLNRPIKAWNVKGVTSVDYYNVVTLHIMEFSTKEYLWPIRQHSLRTNPNLIQNPYW